MKKINATSIAVLFAVALLVSWPGAIHAQVVEDTSDLSIDLDVSAPKILSGSNVTYTITITNDGDTSAPFTVTDELAPQMAVVSCTAAGGGVCGGSGLLRSVAFESLAAGARATITIVATVDCCTPDGTDLANTAEIHPSVPDPEADEVENETVFVTVLNPPPKVTNASASRSQLWPPNHKMMSVAVNYTIEDNCGPVTVTLSVASNEPIDGTGDGDTAPDWLVVDNHDVQLRAERAGNGSGRLYTITITATDCAGQSGTATVTVSVPHDRV